MSRISLVNKGKSWDCHILNVSYENPSQWGFPTTSLDDPEEVKKRQWQQCWQKQQHFPPICVHEHKLKKGCCFSRKKIIMDMEFLKFIVLKKVCVFHKNNVPILQCLFLAGRSYTSLKLIKAVGEPDPTASESGTSFASHNFSFHILVVFNIYIICTFRAQTNLFYFLVIVFL